MIIIYWTDVHWRILSIPSNFDCFDYKSAPSVHLCYVQTSFVFEMCWKVLKLTLRGQVMDGSILFFLRPTAGLTNHPPVRDSNPGAPLSIVSTFSLGRG